MLKVFTMVVVYPPALTAPKGRDHRLLNGSSQSLGVRHRGSSGADGSSSKFDDAMSSNIALVASSGTLKAIGEASRVSTILKLQCEFLLIGDKKICWQYSKVSIELKYMHSFMLFLFSYLICDLTFESTTLN